MKNLKQIFMISLVALIGYCLLFGCCNMFEGLANPPKDLQNADPTQVQCEIHNGMWDSEANTCTYDSIDEEENVPVPEGFANY